MRLYNANFSTNALRVRAVAYELEIELEIVDVDILKGDNRAEDFLRRNPNAKVPVLEDGDFLLWESRAICVYLASQKPEAGLAPTDPRTRSVIDQWASWQAIHLGPAMQKLSFE
jgi:glutathione S-transferase